MMGITARSWNSRMEKPARPWGVPSWLVSTSIWITKAVEDKASVAPMARLWLTVNPRYQNTNANPAVLRSTWLAPRPSSRLRWAQS